MERRRKPLKGYRDAEKTERDIRLISNETSHSGAKRIRDYHGQLAMTIHISRINPIKRDPGSSLINQETYVNATEIGIRNPYL